MDKDVTCIICPLGCSITVSHSEEIIDNLEGHQCEKGKDYAVQEVLNPVRTLTTTVRIIKGELPLVSVKTDRPIPKSRLFEIMDILSGMEAIAPVQVGDVILEDVPELDARIVATKNVGKTNNKYK